MPILWFNASNRLQEDFDALSGWLKFNTEAVITSVNGSVQQIEHRWRANWENTEHEVHWCANQEEIALQRAPKLDIEKNCWENEILGIT
jgi:hypothetical protein